MGGTNELTTFQTSKFTGKLPAKVRKAFQIEWEADYETVRACTAVALSEEDREESRAVLKASLVPCGRALAAERIYALAVAMPSQNREADDRKARAMTYASILQEFPADVLSAACDRLLREETWFPSVATILRRVEPETNRRKMMLAALDKPPVQNCTMLTKADDPGPRRLSFDPTSIRAKHGVPKLSEPLKLPPMPSYQQSPEQIAATAAKDQRAYWLEAMES